MEIFTIENLFTLAMLTMLQAVLGLDNLLYISIESKRVEPHRQASLRKLGIGLAVVLRIVLLFVVMKVLILFKDPFLSIHLRGLIEAEINLHALVVVLGGAFIIYTATKEIMHMLTLDQGHDDNLSRSSFARTLIMIIIMNLVFSFDSILSAIALTDVFAVMAVSIVIGGVLMIWLADHVSEFLAKNRMYEVIGLFILFVVGIMLVTEGGHLAHLLFFGYEIVPMSKATFYFVIAVIILVDVVQSKYASNLMKGKPAVLSNH